MAESSIYDVIIVGGSYAGLSAAMALGRSLRKVLVVDSGMPCNRQTPHSHNFLTQDGQPPHVIAEIARGQVSKYDSVEFHSGTVTRGAKGSGEFEIGTEDGQAFTGKKLLFASGVRDIMPEITGFAECWGISVLHCPYCHGYEVREQVTGILANGEAAFHYAQLVSNLTEKLTIFTNGPSTLTAEQTDRVSRNNIELIETEIEALDHESGSVKNIVLSDGSARSFKAIYSRPNFEQHCTVPRELGCEIAEGGLLVVEPTQRTTADGVYACGDNSNPARSVALAVSSGMVAGAALNKELVEEVF